MNEYLIISWVRETMQTEVKVVIDREWRDPDLFAYNWYEDPSVLRVYQLTRLRNTRDGG